MRFFYALIVSCLVTVNSEVVYVTQYENFTLPDIKLICSSYFDTVSEICNEKLNIVCNNVTLLSTILDASSKFPYSGLGYASKLDYGNFDQCLTVDHSYEGGRILGEHCTMGLFIPDLFAKDSDALTSYYKLSICRPNGCTATDFNSILKNLTNFTLPLFQDVGCQTVETNTEFTVTDIITILIISICIFLMITSSIYDFYLRQKQLECPNRIYTAFSAISNGENLLKISKHSQEQIHTFNGLRVISMAWVIAGHGMAIWMVPPVENAQDVLDWQGKFSSVYIYAAPLSVDTFFFISGFLLAYQYLKQKPKPFMDHLKIVPSLYLHRYLRLTPALLMVYLVVLSLIKHFGSGPMWNLVLDPQASQCRENWWSFFLYIQNYINYDTEQMCLTVTWYLCADMQMFILSPLVLIPVAVILQRPNGFRVAMIQMVILNIIFIVLPLTIKLTIRDYGKLWTTLARRIIWVVFGLVSAWLRKPAKINLPRPRISFYQMRIVT